VYRIEYNTPLGKLLQEGSVELTAATDYEAFAKRMGFKKLTGGTVRWAEGDLVRRHAYHDFVDTVEHLTGVASGEVTPHSGPQQLGRRGRATLMDLLHKWPVDERSFRLAGALAERGSDNRKTPLGRQMFASRRSAIERALHAMARNNYSPNQFRTIVGDLIQAKDVLEMETLVRAI
jgi:hypothetical protein